MSTTSTNTTASGPLAGIRVLDVGILVQGPQAAAYLSDMGADVVKIELPTFGDPARHIHVDSDDTRSAYHAACNRGKQSLTLDLRTPAGADIFKQLAAEADVVVSNFKPGTLDGWGLGFDDLAKQNKRLIWAAGSTFGPLGSDSSREGADLSGQCAGGLISTIGRDGEPPSPVGVTLADHIGALNLTCGILAALHARAASGTGQKVETSLLGGQVWAQAAEFTHFLMTGRVPGRANMGHPLIHAPYRIYETSDGWLGLVGIPPGKQDEFLIAMDRLDLLTDERFESLYTDREHMKWFLHELEDAFKQRSTAEWSESFRAIGIRYAPVNTYAEAAGDEGVWANGYLHESLDSGGTSQKVVGTPLRMSATPLNPSLRAPQIGEHTDSILRSLGLNADEISALREQEVC